MYWLIYLIIFCATSSSVYSIDIQIGGLFHQNDQSQEIAFRHAINNVNSKPNYLQNITLKPIVEYVLQDDSFYASKKACSLFKTGIAAVFGPQTSLAADHVQDICDTLEVPHIETRWNDNNKPGTVAINLYPNYKELSKANVDLVKALKWKSFAIMYDTNDGLIRLQELLKSHDLKNIHYAVYQIDVESKNMNYRPLFNRLKQSGETNIILDCTAENMHRVLKQLQELGLMNEYYNYVITSLDLYTMDLDEFKYGGSNIRGFRLYDPHQSIIEDITKDWSAMVNSSSLHKNQFYQIKNILMYDAVYTFADGLREFIGINDQAEIRSLSCESKDTWPLGLNLVNTIKSNTVEGLTNKIKFNNQGSRIDFQMDIIELTVRGFQKFATWNFTNGITFTKPGGHLGQKKKITNFLQNKTLTIVTRLGAPYCMLRDPDAIQDVSKNDRFEGFAIDLIYTICDMLNVDFVIYISPENAYGSMNPETLKWNGLVGEILDHKADIAISDITITAERESVLDFTLPFMTLGISTLGHTLVPDSVINAITFLSPFGIDIWIYIILVYILVSLVLYFIGRLSPYEKNIENTTNNPLEIKTIDEQNISILHCFWFVIGSFVHQGCNFFPKAISTRFITTFWWIFTAIVLSSYIANLTVLLTVIQTGRPYDVSNVEEFIQQSNTEMGAILGGSTLVFFNKSKDNGPIYKKMWDKLWKNGNGSNLVKNNDDGVQKVINGRGNFQFLMESSTLEYVIERNCNLKQIGNLYDSKGYGIAMRQNSPYLKLFNRAILKLQETGKLQQLKSKWWHAKRSENLCNEYSEMDSVPLELTMDYFFCIFCLLIFGIIIAIIIAGIECVYKKVKDRKR